MTDPNVCPYCTSRNLTAYDSDGDSYHVWMYIRCVTCDKKWTDEYVLSDVFSETD